MQSMIEYFEDRTVPEPNTGCLLWTAAVSDSGYGMFDVDGIPAKRGHRLAWLLYRGPIPRGLHVLHKCDVRSCCNPDHLFLGTNGDNVRDKMSKGRHGFKLSRRQADAIRLDRRTQRAIAQDYGIDFTTVGRIKRGILWRQP
jgi:hypothetical protein